MNVSLSDYILDHYGSCSLGVDCYWGKDPLGRFNGCNRVGWKGRKCPHWQPTGATTWEELNAVCKENNPQDASVGT